MTRDFNKKEGLLKTLKTALKSDGFIMAVFNMLFGENDGKQVEYELKKAGQENTLNEVIVMHRFFKSKIDESKLEIAKDAIKSRKLLKKLNWLKGKDVDFYRKVLIETLKKPGQIAALLYIIKAVVTLGYPIDDLIALPVMRKFFIGLLETAEEIARTEEETEAEEPASINEQNTLRKLRRILKHASSKKTSLNEDESVDRYGGRMPVNVYTGRFQPFHLGHLSNLEEAAKRGLRTVICPVMKGKTTKPEDHPFDAIDGEILQRIKSAYGDLVVDVIPIKNAFVEFWVNPLREAGYEPITWTTGMDRKPAYDAMIEKYKDKYGLVDNFEVIGLSKDMDAEGGSADNTSGISGTAVRKCLVNGDEEGFRRQMPKCLWDMYPEMREIMMQYVQPAITESEAYARYKKYLNEAIEKLVNGE